MLSALWSPSRGDSAAAPDDLTTSGSTLSRLQGFFENHTFDTAGPYSDLFSVLLSCCKHLVDTGLQHHAILSAQRREIARLCSETDALSVLTARCQEALREVQDSAARAPEPLGERLAGLEAMCERMGEAESQLRASLQRDVDELRRRSDAFEVSNAQMRHVQEDVQKLQRGIAAHAEYVDGEISALRQAERDRKSEREKEAKRDEIMQRYASTAEERMQQYTDRRVDVLHSALCDALHESVESRDPRNNVHSNKVHHTRSAVTPTALSPQGRSRSGDSLTDGLRRLRNAAERVDQIESRVEALEVYAPHHCAMAARPPLLGVELRDNPTSNGGGVRVEKVYSGFAAEAVGFAPGDVVIAVNGQEIHTRAEMYAVMTEAAREHQAQRRLTAMAYYKRHYNNSAGGVKENGVKDEEEEEQEHKEEGEEKEWEMPALVLSFHLKRGGLLREVTVTADSIEDTVG